MRKSIMYALASTAALLTHQADAQVINACITNNGHAARRCRECLVRKQRDADRVECRRTSGAWRPHWGARTNGCTGPSGTARASRCTWGLGAGDKLS